MPRCLRSLLPALAVMAAVGCVDRRFVVATNVPAAQVQVDGHALGPAPVDGRFTYGGFYEFRAYAPGFEPVVVREKFKAKWYDYPGLDFIAEVLWPFRIEDVRYVNLELLPARPRSNEELQAAAEALRSRAAALPPPSVPNDPPGTPAPRSRPEDGQPLPRPRPLPDQTVPPIAP